MTLKSHSPIMCSSVSTWVLLTLSLTSRYSMPFGAGSLNMLADWMSAHAASPRLVSRTWTSRNLGQLPPSARGIRVCLTEANRGRCRSGRDGRGLRCSCRKRSRGGFNRRGLAIRRKCGYFPSTGQSGDNEYRSDQQRLPTRKCLLHPQTSFIAVRPRDARAIDGPYGSTSDFCPHNNWEAHRAQHSTEIARSASHTLQVLMICQIVRFMRAGVLSVYRAHGDR